MVKAGSALLDITRTPAFELSETPDEKFVPPNDSIALAISGADIFSVLLVSRERVNFAGPARLLGSVSDPFRIINSTASNGRLGRSATITRRPLSSFVSLGRVKLPSWGGAGDGGVSTPPMAKECCPSAKQNRASNR